jgi:nucleoside diphosphate kinase
MSDFFSIALLKPDISSGFYSFSNCQDTRSSDDATKMFPNGQIVTEIIKRIQKEGMRVQQRKMIHLTKVQARRILRWQQQEESTLYETKLDLITRGPSLALLVTSIKPNENPVDKLKSLVGNSNFDPASIREQFKESPIEEWPLRALCGLDFARDGVYVSQTIDCAFRERYMLFPPAKAQLERAIVGLKPNFISNFSNARELVSNLFDYEGVMILETVEKILQNPKEMRAINEFDGLVGFEDYTSNLEALLRTGRSVVMLVEGLDLTYRLRELVGPLDVVEAKKYFPESLRALYGEEQTLERNGVFDSCGFQHQNLLSVLLLSSSHVQHLILLRLQKFSKLSKILVLRLNFNVV